MQETLTFPTLSSLPHHRYTLSQGYYTDFSETCSPISTPFVSAPSSPGRHAGGGFYFSAPTSPHWANTSAFINPSSHWEEKPGTFCWSCESRSKANGKDEAAGPSLATSDFEFSARFTEVNDPSMSPTPYMSSANELFCNGQIKPLKLPARMEHSFSHVERAPPTTFEFNNRGPFAMGALNSSISAPHSPRFASTFGTTTGGFSTCAISNCSSSLSAPQSPRSRVRGNRCGVSTSNIDKDFNRSIHISIEGSSHPIEISRHAMQDSVDPVMFIEHSKCATETSRHPGEGSLRDPFNQRSRYPTESSRHPSGVLRSLHEMSGTSVLSLAFRSRDKGHRRTRSFSPLRISQREDHTSASSARTFEQEHEHALSGDPSAASEKKHSVQKSSSKKWTLKDLLHRKSGGESRSNSSSRRSMASLDSTSSREKLSVKSLSAGRSSSGSSQSSVSSVHASEKDVNKVWAHVGDSNSGRGRKCATGDANTNHNNNHIQNSMYTDGKVKSISRRGANVSGQKGNKECVVSPHEMHYMMHKAQSEELKKRTFLPYRQGLLGCLGFTFRSYRTASSISKTLQSVSGY